MNSSTSLGTRSNVGMAKPSPPVRQAGNIGHLLVIRGVYRRRLPSACAHVKYRCRCRVNLLNFLGVPDGVIPAHTACSLFSIDLPFLEEIDIATLMRIRTEEGQAFQAFRDALERGFRVLRGENDEEKLRQKTEDL